MDGKGFQVWLRRCAGLIRAQPSARSFSRCCRAGAKARHRRPRSSYGVDEARRCPHCAIRSQRFRAVWLRGSAALPVQGLRQDLQRADRYAAVVAPQETLAVGRGVAGQGGDGEGLGARCDVAVSTAFRWRHRLAAARSDSEVLKGIVEADETLRSGEPEGHARLGRKARRRGGKAKKRGLSREQVPVLMAAGPERDNYQRGVAQGRCGGRSRPGGCEGRAAGRPTVARTHVALPPRSG